MFVVRVAGNVPGRECLGSLNYAVANLPTVKMITVLGHTSCGAVSAAVDALLSPQVYLDVIHDPSLRAIVDALLAGVRMADQALVDTYGRDIREARRLPGRPDRPRGDGQCGHHRRGAGPRGRLRRDVRGVQPRQPHRGGDRPERLAGRAAGSARRRPLPDRAVALGSRQRRVCSPASWPTTPASLRSEGRPLDSVPVATVVRCCPNDPSPIEECGRDRIFLSRSALRGHEAPRISLVRPVSHRRKNVSARNAPHSREAPPVTDTVAVPRTSAHQHRRRRSGREAAQVDPEEDHHLGRDRPAGRDRLGHDRDLPRRDDQRRLVRLRRRLQLPDRVPLLQQAGRAQDHQTGRHPGHSRGVQGERPGLPAHRPAGAVRPPLRRDRRCRPAGRTGAGRPDGLPARHDLDHRRRDPRRCGAGLPGAVLLDAPGRPLAGSDGT